MGELWRAPLGRRRLPGVERAEEWRGGGVGSLEGGSLWGCGRTGSTTGDRTPSAPKGLMGLTDGTDLAARASSPALPHSPEAAGATPDSRRFRQPRIAETNCWGSLLRLASESTRLMVVRLR